MTAARGRWRWRMDGADGAEVVRPTSPVFLTRFDAEQWLGEHWRVIAGQGVRHVVLQHGDDDVPPSLDLPPQPDAAV